MQVMVRPSMPASGGPGIGGACSSSGAGATRPTRGGGSAMPPPSHLPTLVLPAGTGMIGLVGEGLANAVFAFGLPRVGLRAEDRSAFRGKLLRLQKAPRDGRAAQYPYTEVQRYWESEIRPLFKDPDACLVRQQLVVIRREVAAACNRLLAAEEDKRERDDKFNGDWVRDGPQLAMVVDDMRPPPRSLDMMGEFKPKWLTQSPSAPAGSVRCRTCATYLRRFILKPQSSQLSGFQRACRLRLCDESPSPPSTPVGEGTPATTKTRADAPPLIRAATFPATRASAALASGASPPTWSKEALLSSIRAHPLMRELRTIQAQLDTHGPLHAGPDDADFQKAMTLRDCTCYVYVSRSTGGATSVSVRLGDLDRKDGEAKGEYWARTERTLIEGGFYTARAIVVGDDRFDVPVKCVLGAAPWAGAGPVPAMDVAAVGKQGVAGQGIVVLGARGGDALIGVKEVDTLRTELEKLQRAAEKKAA